MPAVSHQLLLAILSSIYLAQMVTTIISCSQDNKPQPTKYYFVTACTRSTMKMIAARFYDTLDQCKNYALRRRGFAINFVHKELLHRAAKNFSGETCLVYDCPEFDVRTTVDTSSVYDYYSAYATPLSNTNVSCIPKLGVYQLHKIRANYSEAEIACNEDGGTLADITTRFHTEQLASLISSERIKQAYVGLNRLEYPPEFLNSRGLPLNCNNYRAWAPGEPKPKPRANCVVLTSKMQWKISLCNKELPFLCELIPDGPYRPCAGFYNRRRRQKCQETFMASMPKSDRYPKCGDPKFLETLKKNNSSNRETNTNYDQDYDQDYDYDNEDNK